MASLRSVFAVVQPWLQYVPLYGTLWGMAMASDTAHAASISPAEVDARIAQHNLRDLQLYSGNIHHALLAHPPFFQKLLAQPATPIDDGDELQDNSLDLQASRPLRLLEA